MEDRPVAASSFRLDLSSPSIPAGATEGLILDGASKDSPVDGFRLKGSSAVSLQGGLDSAKEALISSSAPNIISGSCKLLLEDAETSCHTISVSSLQHPKDAIPRRPISSGAEKPHVREADPSGCVTDPSGRIAVPVVPGICNEKLKGGIVLAEGTSVPSSIPILPLDTRMAIGEGDPCSVAATDVSDPLLKESISDGSASFAKLPCSQLLAIQLTGSGNGGASPPSSSLPSCPVRDTRSGWPDGPCSAPRDAPQVPVTTLLPAHSKFEICPSMFPPLLSSSASVEITPPPAPPKDFSGASCELDVAKAKQPSDWASLLKESPSSMQLKFIKPEFSSNEGKVTIKLPLPL